MPIFSRLLGKKNGDEPGKKETDADYFARMVRKYANSDNFSALTFRFSYNLGLDLSTAELARMIAIYDYPVTSLNRFSELELSAASVYMASHVRRIPRSLNEVAQMTKVDSNVLLAVYTELYLALLRLKDVEWHDVFGGPRNISAAEARRTLSFPPLKSTGIPA